jgi:hypothetical protein
MNQDHLLYKTLEKEYPELFKNFNDRFRYEETASELILIVEVIPSGRIDIEDLVKLKQVWVPFGNADFPGKSSYSMKIVPAVTKRITITSNWILPGQ